MQGSLFQVVLPIQKLVNPTLRKLDKTIEVGKKADMAEYVNSESWFNMYHHRILDSKGKRPFLDGSIHYIPATYAENDLERLKAHLSKHNKSFEHIDRLIEDLRFYQEISKSSFKPLNEKVDKGEISQLILDKIKSTKTGESVIIPGGTNEHAIVYEIKNEGWGIYSFRIINRGEAAAADDRKKAYDVVYYNLTLETLNSDFFQELFQMMESENNMTSVYSKIDDRLFNNNNYSQELGKKQQSQGTCGYKSLLPFIQKRLTPQEYKIFKYLLTKEDLITMEKIVKLPPLFLRFIDRNLTQNELVQMHQ